MKRCLILALLAVLLSGCMQATPCPTPAACPTCAPAPSDTPAPTVTPTPAGAQLDPRFEEMGVWVNVRNGRYKLIAAWAWRFGDITTAPAWAQKWMGAPQMGADHNVFGVVVGTVVPVDFRLYWPDGDTVRAAAGWIDVPIYARMDCKGCGAYTWRVDGGDELRGLGLWQGEHWSFACVWVDSQPLALHVGR